MVDRRTVHSTHTHSAQCTHQQCAAGAGMGGKKFDSMRGRRLAASPTVAVRTAHASLLSQARCCPSGPEVCCRR
jgi:hypothetical protein